MSRRDIAIMDEDDRVAALVTVTPMFGDSDLADEARDLLAEEMDVQSTPVEVFRDE